uniref:COP9 signalosome complex subunit 3 n=1 Tax=Cacopsylla melanoneura TaxID=428564 RepID=A0A8D8UJW0_9HEMI
MATALEQFVNNVRQLSAQGNFRELTEIIQKSLDVLSKNGQHLDNVLETLETFQHSLGILAILLVKLNLLSTATTNEYQEVLFSQIQEFINVCNPEQIRHAGDLYADLSHQYTKAVIDLKTPQRGIPIIRAAIKKIQTCESQLTSLHSDLCQLCLLAMNFKPALEFLDVEITTIANEGPQFDTKYFLQYFYYGGMIYLSLKNYERALYLFEVIITTPALAVSHIMLEGYKKYLLVYLIVNGKAPNLPKNVSQAICRYIKPLCQPYLDLVSVYTNNNSIELQMLLNKYQEIFSRDENTGLTKQILVCLTKNNIKRLTRTFLTLSLADVASRVQLGSPVEAEIYILKMISQNEIYATINKKDGMVVFNDSPQRFNNPMTFAQIEARISDCMQLDAKFQQMEEEILVNPLYVKKATSPNDEEGGVGGGGGGGAASSSSSRSSRMMEVESSIY